MLDFNFIVKEFKMNREELDRLRDECANLLLFEKECTCEFPDYGDCPYHDKNFDVNYGFDAAVDALWPVVEENQKLRAQVAEAKKSLNEAIGEMVCLGTDLEELNNRTRHYPTALLCPEILERCQKTLARLEGVYPVAAEAKPLQNPEIVLDGADINQDIHQLVGYCWSLGNTEKVFPSSHCSDLCEEFLKKHRPNPVQEGGE